MFVWLWVVLGFLGVFWVVLDSFGLFWFGLDGWVCGFVVRLFVGFVVFFCVCLIGLVVLIGCVLVV